MSTSRFPNLRAIYRQQVEVDKDDYKNYFVVASCALILSVLYGAYITIIDRPMIIAEPELVGVIGVVALVSIFVIRYLSNVSLRKFELAWEERFRPANTSEAQLQYFEDLEAELHLGSVAYTELILTRSYMIFPDQLAHFIPVRAIDSVHISEYPKYRRSAYDVDLFPADMIYHFGAVLADGSRRFLSNDENEIRELMHEILSRHPKVGFTDQAKRYFYPTPVQVE